MFVLQSNSFLSYVTRSPTVAQLALRLKLKSISRLSHSDVLPLLSRQLPPLAEVPNPLPAAYLRGGTSKGIFINRRYLPPLQADWGLVFKGIMGSPDLEYGRQLNGMGGGISSLSKIMVVGPASDRCPPHIDAEYTFAQVGVRDGDIDYSGNCGNLSSMVGAFAVDEGICVPRVGQSHRSGMSIGTVHVWNTNTKKEFHTTFPVTPDLKPVLDMEEISIAGVPGLASQISVESIDPAGARTGQLLPTGNPVDKIKIGDIYGDEEIAVSLIDATNPTVFISPECLNGKSILPGQELYSDPDVSERIERIRQAGAVAMGLDPAANAQPKIAIIGVPPMAYTLNDSSTVDIDIEIHAMSMGVLHRAIPMTVGLCLAVAVSIKGTIPHRIFSNARGRSQDFVTEEHQRQCRINIRHPSGIVNVGAEFDDNNAPTKATVFRTGRRLMQGAVWW